MGDITGSMLTPGYSPISQAISELIESGAPAKPLVDPFLLVFHGLAVAFALGLGARLGGRGGQLGAGLLALAGVTGVILTLLFPCDPGCQPITWRGTAHIFLAIPMGFAALFSILAFSFARPGVAAWPQFTAYARLTFAAGVVLAIVTVAMAETSLVGLLERLLTLSYLQWYVVVGVWLMRRKGRGHP